MARASVSWLAPGHAAALVELVRGGQLVVEATDEEAGAAQQLLAAVVKVGRASVLRGHGAFSQGAEEPHAPVQDGHGVQAGCGIRALLGHLSGCCVLPPPPPSCKGLG